MTPNLPRRRFLGLVGAGIGTLSGCGYRPGGGDIRWTAETGTGGYRPDHVLPASDGETVFAVNRSSRSFDWETEQWGRYADLTAYDAASGEERWDEQTEPVSQPTVHRETLYVGHDEGGITAFDADGETRWQVDTDAAPRRLAAAADRVYAATSEGELVAFAAGDETPLWRSELGEDGSGVVPVATGDGAYVTLGGRSATTVVALDRGGERRWRTDFTNDGRLREVRPVVTDETVYVPTRSELFALGVRDGEERWSQTLGSRPESPAVADGVLYHASDGTLYALDAAEGTEKWRFSPDSWSSDTSSPAATASGVYVDTSDSLYSLEPSDGSVRWHVDSEGTTTEPVVVGQTVVVTDDGYIRGHWRE